MLEVRVKNLNRVIWAWVLVVAASLCSAMAFAQDAVLLDKELDIRVDRDEVMRYFSPLGPGRTYTAMEQEGNVELAVERLYVSKVIAKRALEDGRFSREQLDFGQQDAARRALMSWWLSAKVDEQMALVDWEALALDFFTANQSNYQTPPLVRTRHIFISEKGRGWLETVQTADQIRARLLNGEDFGSLAAALSDGPAAKDQGDLGFTGPGQLLPELEKALDQLEPGEVSEILVSSFGAHLIMLIERQSPSQREFDAVKESIIDTLKKQRQSEIRQTLITEVKRMVTREGVLLDREWMGAIRNPDFRGDVVSETLPEFSG